jgi:hypothetical protein
LKGPGGVRTLYVHVGPAKTGTSAIQHALKGAQDEDPPILYPLVGLSRGGSHNHLVANLIGDQSRPDVTRVPPEELLAQLRAAIGASRRDVMISSEALAAHQDMGRFISTLTGVFPGKVRVQWLIVCREHFARISSAYNQRVKDAWLRERETPDEFLRGRGAAFRYQQIIRRLRETGFPVSAISYHPAESLVERFMQTIGLPPERMPSAEQRNISLSAKGLVATLAANNVAATPQERERYFNALRTMKRFFAPSKFIFSAAATHEVAQRLQPDREFLATRMGVTLPEAEAAPADGGLYIAEAEYAEICAATRSLGEEGAAIAAYAARFKREALRAQAVR